MKKLILYIFINLLTITSIYASNTNIKQARVIGVFDKDGNGENVQHIRKTKADYNGICFTKIVVIGDFYHTKPIVYIGKSKGIFQKQEPVYNKYKIKIGTILIYKHFNVSKGYVKITVDNKLFDYRVFVK